MSTIAKLASTVEIVGGSRQTADNNSTGVDIGDYTQGFLVILNSGAGGGTTPTMDCVIQESATVGGTYTNVTGGAFTQVTDAAGGIHQAIEINADASKGFIRIAFTITGTSPTFDCAIVGVGQKKVAG